MSLEQKIRLSELPPNQKELAEIIGLDNYIALTKRFGGSDMYIAKYSELIKDPRNEEIREKFDGYNSSELARTYNLSERYIRGLVSDLIREAKAKPMDGQMTFG